MYQAVDAAHASSRGSDAYSIAVRAAVWTMKTAPPKGSGVDDEGRTTEGQQHHEDHRHAAHPAGADPGPGSRNGDRSRKDGQQHELDRVGQVDRVEQGGAGRRGGVDSSKG